MVAGHPNSQKREGGGHTPNDGSLVMTGPGRQGLDSTWQLPLSSFQPLKAPHMILLLCISYLNSQGTVRTAALSPIVHTSGRTERVSPAPQGHRPCPNPGGTVLFLSCCWALATAPHNPSLVQMRLPKFNGSAREMHTLPLCKESYRLLACTGTCWGYHCPKNKRVSSEPMYPF